MIEKTFKNHNSDGYVKYFKRKDYLFSTVFCCLEKCNSLREVSGGILGLSGKEETVRINHLPRKSTLADANKGRKVMNLAGVGIDYTNKNRMTVYIHMYPETSGSSLVIDLEINPPLPHESFRVVV